MRLCVFVLVLCALVALTGAWSPCPETCQNNGNQDQVTCGCACPPKFTGPLCSKADDTNKTYLKSQMLKIEDVVVKQKLKLCALILDGNLTSCSTKALYYDCLTAVSRLGSKWTLPDGSPLYLFTMRSEDNIGLRCRTVPKTDIESSASSGLLEQKMFGTWFKIFQCYFYLKDKFTTDCGKMLYFKHCAETHGLPDRKEIYTRIDTSLEAKCKDKPALYDKTVADSWNWVRSFLKDYDISEPQICTHLEYVMNDIGKTPWWAQKLLLQFKKEAIALLQRKYLLNCTACPATCQQNAIQDPVNCVCACPHSFTGPLCSQANDAEKGYLKSMMEQNKDLADRQRLKLCASILDGGDMTSCKQKALYFDCLKVSRLDYSLISKIRMESENITGALCPTVPNTDIESSTSFGLINKRRYGIWFKIFKCYFYLKDKFTTDCGKMLYFRHCARTYDLPDSDQYVEMENFLDNNCGKNTVLYAVYWVDVLMLEYDISETQKCRELERAMKFNLTEPPKAPESVRQFIKEAMPLIKRKYVMDCTGNITDLLTTFLNDMEMNIYSDCVRKIDITVAITTSCGKALAYDWKCLPDAFKMRYPPGLKFQMLQHNAEYMSLALKQHVCGDESFFSKGLANKCLGKNDFCQRWNCIRRAKIPKNETYALSFTEATVFKIQKQAMKRNCSLVSSSKRP